MSSPRTARNATGTTPRRSRFPVTLTALFLVCLVLTGIASIALGIAGLDLGRSLQSVERTLRVREALEHFERAMIEAEGGQRGFLLTGQPHFLEPYVDAVAKQAYFIGTLEGLTADNPAQQHALEALKLQANARLRHLAQVMELQRSGAFSLADARENLNVGKRLMDEVRRTVGTMRSAEERQLALRQSEVDRRGRYGIVLLLLANVANILGLVVLYIAMRRYHRRRLAAEAGLVERERDYRILFETSAIGQVECDPRTGRFLRVNHTAARMFGRNPDELHRLSLLDVLPRGNRLDNARALRELAAGQRDVILLEQPVMHPDDSSSWVAIHGTVVRNEAGEPLRIVAAIEDVTTERAAVEDVRKMQGMLGSLVEGLADPVIVKDCEGRWVAANGAALQTFGAAREEALGRRDSEILPDPAGARTLREFEARVMRSRIHEALDVELRTATGTQGFRWSCSPWTDPEGDVVGVVVIAHPATDASQH